MRRIFDKGRRSFLVACTVACTALVRADSPAIGGACEFGTDRFGERLHVVGDGLVIVASPYADGGAGWCGVLDPSTCEIVQSWVGAPGTALGSALAHADLDRDGRTDLVIAAPGSITGEIPGEVRIHRGLEGGFSQEPTYRLTERQPGESFGSSLLAFDPDGDGWLDLAVGAGTFSGRWTFEGAVHLYRSRVGGPAAMPWGILTGRATGAAFGRSLDAADFDGDGRDDLLVGSPEGSWGQNREGRAEIFLGTGSGLSSFPSWAVEGGEPYAYFGFSVGATPLDSGEGGVLWAVGAPGVAGGRGRCSVYRGPGLPVSPDLVRSVDEVGAWFGGAIEPVSGRACPSAALAVSSPGAGAGDGRVEVVVWDPRDQRYRWGTAMAGEAAGYLGTSLSSGPGGLWVGAPWEETPVGRGSVHRWTRPSFAFEDDSLHVLVDPGGAPPTQALEPPWTLLLSPQPVGPRTVVQFVGDVPCRLEWTTLAADGRRLGTGTLHGGDRLAWSEAMSGGARTGWLTVSDGTHRRTVRWVWSPSSGR
ncbi:MAG: VCBS repeat-containing protein [Candidatus Eisenbacteria bacterium]